MVFCALAVGAGTQAVASAETMYILFFFFVVVVFFFKQKTAYEM